jgi:teichuronic acid biosynthesis glycosyltransferase TuaG
MISVSVIIPYFKKRNFIEKTINSIKSQTYKNLEIIIVFDDTDHSDLKFIKKIQKSDRRIKLIVNRKQLGAGFSRNIGIKHSTSNYVAFIDADDLWKKNKIELQLKFMIKNRLLISHTSYEILKKNQKNKKILRAKSYTNHKQLLYSCDIGLSTVMLKKKLISKKCQFPKLKTKEDFVLWLLILKKNIKIGALDKNLTVWRKLDNSLSSSALQKLRDGFSLYRYYMKFDIFKSFFYLLILSINFLRK